MPGFEFAVANSILLVILSGIYTVGFITKRKFPGKKNPAFPYKIFGVFLFLPLAISLLHSFFTMMCSLKEGVIFYLVFTIPSVFIGFSLGLFCVVFFKRFRKTIFIVLVILIVSIPLFEFYFNPQVYFLNPVFGYFPGTIYDEGIKIGLRIISYRVLNLIYFLSIAFISWKIFTGQTKFAKKNALYIFLIIPLLFILFSPFLGYSTTNSSLQKVLSKEIVTNHFNIFFSNDLPDSTAKEIALEHEYQYLKLSDFFGTRPDKKITSYVFSNSVQKGIYFGSENADVAKPWLNQVYISTESYDQTLRHELAHVFSGTFGTGIFKVADGFNPALIEGIAVAAYPFYGTNTIDFMASLAYKNGFRINVENLFSGLNFFGKVSSVSYIYAGSFSKYLIDNYGVTKYSEYYAGRGFEKIYDDKFSAIANKYYEFLNNYNISGNEKEAYFYFGRQTIFQKVCPRYIADRLEDGWKEYSQKRYSESEDIFKEILGKTANYFALVGLSEIYSAEGKYKESAELLDKWINKFTKTAYYYNLELRLADNYSLTGSNEKADSLYSGLFNESPNRALHFIAELRKTLSGRTGLLYKYLSGSDSQKYEILKNFNSENYQYCSFPALINLAENLNIPYKSFISQFDRPFIVDSYESSYAAYILSLYMIKNSDFDGARKTAGLSLKFSTDQNFNEILRANFDKSIWIYYNAGVKLVNLQTKKQ